MRTSYHMARSISVIVLDLIIEIGFLLLGQTAGLAQRLGDDPLQLAVGGTELVGCPLFNGTTRRMKLFVAFFAIVC